MKKIDADNANAIVKGCLKGRSDCQELLFKMHYSKMMAVCYRYASDFDEAKDLLQEGFIKVFDKLDKFNFKGSLEGWIRRIIVNNCIDAYRKKKFNTLSLDDDIDIERFETIEMEDDKDTTIYNDLDINDVADALQQLSPAYKAVFNLYIMEGYTHKEIAETLDISVGSSKSNLAKAKMKIKKILLKKRQKQLKVK